MHFLQVRASRIALALLWLAHHWKATQLPPLYPFLQVCFSRNSTMPNIVPSNVWTLPQRSVHRRT
ncbi:hypothetical protein D915_011125 [Fasciola hepatica]|uniref:Secreted protein n=1 Tax=Fasciola hepatica TaxID=6192 RepID=A0A4E0QYH6_FASHE|nr:hypothetical protein D915_011125 [Fasciola hepatica]